MNTRRRHWLVPGLLALSALAACSGSSDGGGFGSNDSFGAFTPDPVDLSGVGLTALTGPITGGKGEIIVGTDTFDGSTFGYSQAEYFVSGTAQSYTSAQPLSDDGMWSVEPNDTADYTTRIVVRRPEDPADFNGTVFVEWLNVTAGLDVPPIWSYAKVELMRSGAIWVGVSAQRVGVEGGGNPLGEVRVLKKADPERYGSLSHPGDNYSYDIFSQVGATLWRDGDGLFGGLEPQRIIAMGESQSAFRLTTYVDAIAPSQDVYQGYLVHSRGARSAPLSADPGPDVPGPTQARIRSDNRRPVLTLSSETDVVGEWLGYRKAAQPDSATFRSWEITGTAHADAYSLGIGDSDDGSGRGGADLFSAMLTPPTSVYFGLITCDKPLNAGPHTYVVRAALSALDAWVRTGVPPQSMPLLEVNADLSGYLLDDNGNALGGIRTPFVDVPVAVLSGLGQEGESFCRLFGTTSPFSAETLATLYTDKADFIAKWTAATQRAVDAGAILAADAPEIIAAAENYPG